MSKSAATGLDFHRFVFNSTPIPWSAATDLQINLHNSDPTETGEADEFTSVYGGYQPVIVPRSSEFFIVGDPTVNAVDITFPQCTSGSDVITHVSVSPVGFTQVIYYGTLASPLIVTAGVQPQFKARSLQFTEN